MTLLPWTIASAACAAVPALLTVWNMAEYREPPVVDPNVPGGPPPSAVSVIIPARNEEQNIAECVERTLASRGGPVEILVVDDDSSDATAAIVAAIAQRDGRVRLFHAEPLPGGWNGKQHACWQGAQAASHPLLCFLDADVRLQPDALVRLATSLQRERASLISGFPREVTGTLLEKLLIPLIHFVLLGYLPMRFLRTTNSPGFAAGCGQLLMVERKAYFASDGHQAIRNTMHDGLLLPRLLRQRGYSTRLADLTQLAACRMYTSAATTWSGLSKNATEGIAAPSRIGIFTVLLGLGQVLPGLLLIAAWFHTTYIIPFLGPPIRVGMAPVWWAAAALVLSYLPRVLNAIRYRQSWLGALLHPLGVLLLLVLQWAALLRKLTGGSATWKSRSYSAK